jgi:dihydrofolate reductase
MADRPRSQPLVALVAAVAANGVIGRAGALPWRIPDDMARFRALTMGHAVIMGRATWQSLRRPLAGRSNIVLTRTPDLAMTGCTVVHSAEDALAAAGGAGAPGSSDPAPVFVIGGASVYALFLPLARRMHLTRVDVDVAGDIVFPEVAWDEWVVTAETAAPPADGVLPHRFVDYERNAGR